MHKPAVKNVTLIIWPFEPLIFLELAKHDRNAVLELSGDVFFCWPQRSINIDKFFFNEHSHLKAHQVNEQFQSSYRAVFSRFQSGL